MTVLGCFPKQGQSQQQQHLFTDTGKHDMEKHLATFHDAITGETIVRELTPEEIAELPEVTNETPLAD